MEERVVRSVILLLNKWADDQGRRVQPYPLLGVPTGYIHTVTWTWLVLFSRAALHLQMNIWSTFSCIFLSSKNRFNRNGRNFCARAQGQTSFKNFFLNKHAEGVGLIKIQIEYLSIKIWFRCKFKILKLSYQMCAAHKWSIKSRRTKKLIA